MKTKTEIILFAILMASLIPLELFCGILAYETLGAVTSQVYLAGTLLFNLAFIILAFRYRSVAILAVIVFALLIIPYQLVLGQRLLRVQAEATRIVAYAYEQKIQTGAFPANLSGYTATDAEMMNYIQNFQLDETGEQFTVHFRVGTENTSHWYSSEDGWGYYPD